MALNQISVVGPRAEQREPKEEKKDWWEKVIEGLQVAKGITGIAVDYQTIQKYRADRAAQEDVQSGIMTQKNKADFQNDGLTPVAPGTPGAVVHKFRTGPGEGDVEETALIKAAKPEKTPTGAWVETMVNGKKGKIWKEGAEGAFVEAPPESTKPPKDIYVQERNTLQNQYDRNQTTRANAMVLSGYEDAKGLMSDPSPAADQALIIAFVKAHDPTSVVKESEAETTQAMGGLEKRAMAKWQEMTGGGKLTPEQRQDLFKQIELKAKNAASRQTSIDKQFTDLAKRRSVDPQDLRFSILPSFEAAGAPAGQNPGEAFAAPMNIPKVGTEEGGYVFQGGDPADQKNWKPKGAK